MDSGEKGKVLVGLCPTSDDREALHEALERYGCTVTTPIHQVDFTRRASRRRDSHLEMPPDNDVFRAAWATRACSLSPAIGSQARFGTGIGTAEDCSTTGGGYTPPTGGRSTNGNRIVESGGLNDGDRWA